MGESDTPSEGLLLRPGGGPLRESIWPSSPPTVLVVDRDRVAAEHLARTLDKYGSAVVVRSTLDEVWQERTSDFDLVFLETALVGDQGAEVIARLRRGGHTGGVCFTGPPDRRTAATARVDGADDYVSKPFSRTEVVTHAIALMRRLGGRDTDTSVPGTWPVIAARLARARAEVDVALSRSQRRLLSLLTQRRGGVVSREELAALALENPRISPSAAYKHVSRLRRTLRRFGLTVSAKSGCGYYLALRD
ncbi:MAG: response regulator transcription factor [Polyangiaceae bacterium]|nr:response regulator transcription factor [Polyangiaceae bacterium]